MKCGQQEINMHSVLATLDVFRKNNKNRETGVSDG